MGTFRHRGKDIEDTPEDVVEKRRDVSNQEFGKRALAELIGIIQAHTELLHRVDVLQDEIRRRILKNEKPAIVVPKMRKK